MHDFKENMLFVASRFWEQTMRFVVCSVICLLELIFTNWWRVAFISWLGTEIETGLQAIVENQILDPKPPKQIFDLDTTD